MNYRKIKQAVLFLVFSIFCVEGLANDEIDMVQKLGIKEEVVKLDSLISRKVKKNHYLSQFGELRHVHSFGQDMYTNKIKWEEHVETITCSDTCDIISIIQQGCAWELIFYKKMLTFGDQSFYCVFVPIGSGVSRWLISVYLKKEDKWHLVAKGTIVRDVLALTARINSNNDKILFFTANCIISKTAVEVKEEVEEIGELSLSDLLK